MTSAEWPAVLPIQPAVQLALIDVFRPVLNPDASRAAVAAAGLAAADLLAEWTARAAPYMGCEHTEPGTALHEAPVPSAAAGVAA